MPRRKKVLKKEKGREWGESYKKYIAVIKGAETIDEARQRVLKAGYKINEVTLINVASRAGIKEASSLSWGKTMQRYADKAKGAKTVDEVRTKLEKAGHRVSEVTALNIAYRLGVKEASAQIWKRETETKAVKEAMERFDEVAKGANINLFPFGNAQRLVLGEELILQGKVGKQKGKIKSGLKKRGFIEAEIDMLLEELQRREDAIKRIMNKTSS